MTGPFWVDPTEETESDWLFEDMDFEILGDEKEEPDWSDI